MVSGAEEPVLGVGVDVRARTGMPGETAAVRGAGKVIDKELVVLVTGIERQPPRGIRLP